MRLRLKPRWPKRNSSPTSCWRSNETPDMMSNPTRRRVLLSASAALALGACARADGGGAAKQSGPVSIQYLGRGSAGEEEIYRSLIKDFQDRNPAISVDINWA